MRGRKGYSMHNSVDKHKKILFTFILKYSSNTLDRSYLGDLSLDQGSHFCFCTELVLIVFTVVLGESESKHRTTWVKFIKEKVY